MIHKSNFVSVERLNVCCIMQYDAYSNYSIDTQTITRTKVPGQEES